MKISLNWLKQYIDIPDTQARLSEILTDLGLEVEGMEEVQTVPGGLEGLIVGEVLTCEKHPNADKLSLTTVNVGREKPLQIVCGAPNVAQGQKVIVATVGTMLYPSEGEPFKIKKGKIRQEVSEGMICAEDEIGLGTSHGGIIVLPSEVATGLEAAKHYDLESDYVFDIGLTPNRSDATSHIGVAKDLAAYYTYATGNKVNVKIPETGTVLETGKGHHIKVDVKHSEGCPRFSGISVTNVSVGPSPKWMQERLQAIGVRPISNIVDITNFVLHEFGQPLHAYDQSKIQQQAIVVQTLDKGSKFTTLDEKDRSLASGDLMICDGSDNGLCIAGVFGGLTSGVTDATTDIFLEAAHFNPLMIRKTSTIHNLRTDAARCFEKGSDPNVTIAALARAVSLMIEYAGAKVSSELVDIYPDPIVPKEIPIKLSHVNRLMGAALSPEILERILASLSIEVVSKNDDDYIVSIPTDKADVLREADVIEEVLRIYGFNNIEIAGKLSISIPISKGLEMPQLKRILAQQLVAEGFNEMMGLSLIPSKYYEAFPEIKERLVYINNTSNIHLDVMRPEMVISGLVSIAHNLNRQQSQLALYEFGRTYQEIEGTKVEKELLTLWMTGGKQRTSWNQTDGQIDFFKIKRTVQRILARIGVIKYQVRETNDERLSYGLQIHRGEQIIASFGSVNQKSRRILGVDEEVFYAEMNLPVLRKIASKAKTRFEEIPKFPSSTRDLSLVIANERTYQEMERIIQSKGGKLLQSVELFDIYKDAESLGQDLKSYAVSLTFVDHVKSLQDKVLDKIMANIIRELEAKMGAKLR
ncbi:MAG: phenylalanyl-tRNA synthetase beta chain [Saprospiraceae bacterium]|jgi:phenylalanyl-tRNA synthetase beta chain